MQPIPKVRTRTTTAMLVRLRKVYGSEADHNACRADAATLHRLVDVVELMDQALEPRPYGGPTTGMFQCPDCQMVWGRGRWHKTETHNAGCLAQLARGELRVLALNSGARQEKAS